MNPFRPVIYIIGWLLFVLGLSELLPAIVDYLYRGGDYKYFCVSSFITCFLGGLLILAFYQNRGTRFTLRETFLLTPLSWLVLTFFAAIPFYLSLPNFGWINALFESASGLTTTGATVIEDTSLLTVGLHVWRSTLQWLGGIGIIVMAMSILPVLKVGGMELFKSESSDHGDKLLPRMNQIVTSILFLYVGLTLLCFILLKVSGLEFVEAFCHSLCVVSTGGFSLYSDSILHYKGTGVPYIIMIFMFIGSFPQLLLARAFVGRARDFFSNSQVKLFFIILLIAISIMVFWRMSQVDMPLSAFLLETTFNVLSILSTAGYTYGDYGNWGSFALVFFFFLPFIGGCTGSTSGGIKVLRYQVMAQLIKRELYLLRRPHAVVVPNYGSQPISEKSLFSVSMLFMIFFFTFMVVTFTLALLGEDFLTACSASISMLSNLGPGLGPKIGPSGSYETMSDGVKSVLTFTMFLGRLEFAAILVLFMPSFWKN